MYRATTEKSAALSFANSSRGKHPAPSRHPRRNSGSAVLSVDGDASEDLSSALPHGDDAWRNHGLTDEDASEDRAPKRLNEAARTKIFAEYRGGMTVEGLAERYGRTKGTMQRIVNEMRCRHILELPLEFIPNPQFSQPAAEATIMAEMPISDVELKKTRIPASLSPYLASLYEDSLLTREQEGHLFRQFNYLKYKAAELRRQLDPAQPKQSLLDAIERLHEQAVAVKNQIVRANLRLVVSIAKRYVGHGDGFFELVSDGNVSLMRAIDKFDFARGNKISTYASWAIMRNFSRSIPSEQRYQDRFRTSQTDVFSDSVDFRSDPDALESAQTLRASQVRKILERLDDRERSIVVSRFGLEDGDKPQSLQQIGDQLGVSKERIRQIVTRAMGKLRLAAAEEHLEAPDFDGA